MPNQTKSVLIAPNSFKECSDSITITNIIYNNLKKNLDCNLIRKPISDGGGMVLLMFANITLMGRN